MFNDFYKGKRVFITGHTGFKGSWLLLWLNYLGAEIKGYALKPRTQKDHFITAGLESKAESVIADIRDFEKLQKEIKYFRPQVVFHLAAQPLVRESYVNPRETYEVNVMGTVNILEALKGCDSVLSFVNVTSDKCYENVEKEAGYQESDPLGGYDPYSSSKGCSELVTAAFRKSFFDVEKGGRHALVTSARAGNVIGGGDWCRDRIMTDSIMALMNKRSIEIRNPEAVRPWQYVLEPLSGYLWLAAQAQRSDFSSFGGGWNFGPKTSALIKVKDVVDLVVKCWGEGGWKDVSDPAAPHEARLLMLDCAKAEAKLGWQPVLDVAKSVEMTVLWYKEFADNEDRMGPYSLGQLEEYIKTAASKNIAWTY